VRHELFAPERDNPVPAVTASYSYLDLVYELHAGYRVLGIGFWFPLPNAQKGKGTPLGDPSFPDQNHYEYASFDKLRMNRRALGG
jgi:hypothetical protein